MITKDGKSYTYNLTSSEKSELFPLQQGNGTYKVSVLENTNGNKYKTINSENVQVNLNNANMVYLNSVQNVEWDISARTIQEAQQMMKSTKSDQEKMRVIYNYIVNNISYDEPLANSVASNYIQNINNTFSG